MGQIKNIKLHIVTDIKITMDWNITPCVGAFTILYVSCKVFAFLWKILRCYVLALFFRTTVDLRKYGEWVIVTGATDGIGKEYARQFARRGFNIVLISRTAEKLHRVQKEIEEEFNVATIVIIFDFDKTEGYDRIEAVIKDLDVGILVNNVGRATAGRDKFVCTDIDEVDNVLRCNMFSTVHMTHMVLKGMLERQRGLIIHLSSLVSAMDLPIPVYSPTKAFIQKFHRSLQLESSGVDHQLVMPGYVATNLSRQSPHFVLIPTPEEYVRSAMCTIGLVDTTCGYWLHDIMYVFCQCVPKYLWTLIAQKVAQHRKNK